MAGGPTGATAGQEGKAEFTAKVRPFTTSFAQAVFVDENFSKFSEEPVRLRGLDDSLRGRPPIDAGRPEHPAFAVVLRPTPCVMLRTILSL